jgi:hypothetical protein
MRSNKQAFPLMVEGYVAFGLFCTKYFCAGVPFDNLAKRIKR